MLVIFPSVGPVVTRGAAAPAGLRIESGDYSSWSLPNLRKLAAVFDVAPAAEFVSFEDVVGRIEKSGAHGFEIRPGYGTSVLLTAAHQAFPRSPQTGTSSLSIHDCRPTLRAWFDRLVAARERAIEVAGLETFKRL